MQGQEGVGDTWTWTSIDADSKLMIAWYVGPRNAGSAHKIAHDVAWRMDGRVQITTDGLHAYWDAICDCFPGDLDFAQLVKIYGESTIGKYSPAECVGVKIEVRVGDPDPKHISTSYIERSNLTARMGMRRFTRLTNAFSKKLDNHKHAIALHHFHYNFIRKHQTIKTTPAVMAGVASKAWTMVDFVELMEKEEELLGRRISDYKPAKPNRVI
ncbi:MAG: IS1 family transposase [Planctomycetota bacterium]|nr:IS1 family transposase [Planctomycetota bacterium]